MKKLTHNIINIHGKKGEHWIADLPSLVATLKDCWNLSLITPVNNMTFNYVAKALSNTEQPVILKISYDAESIANEKHALTIFNGNGAIRLIDVNKNYNALLLQQAIPGMTLTSLYPEQSEYVMDCYVNTLEKLHSNNLTNMQNHRHIADWLKVIDKLTPDQIPKALLNRAINLRDKLLQSMRPLVFLHGDLHHDNILQHGNEWVAIDPKGIIGEPEFEIAAFYFMYVSELAKTVNVKNIIQASVSLLAQKSKLDADRIMDWVFVRLVLMAAWQIEDNEAPSWALKLADQLI